MRGKRTNLPVSAAVDAAAAAASGATVHASRGRFPKSSES